MSEEIQRERAPKTKGETEAVLKSVSKRKEEMERKEKEDVGKVESRKHTGRWETRLREPAAQWRNTL